MRWFSVILFQSFAFNLSSSFIYLSIFTSKLLWYLFCNPEYNPDFQDYKRNGGGVEGINGLLQLDAEVFLTELQRSKWQIPTFYEFIKDANWSGKY